MAYLGIPPFGRTARTVTEIVAASGQTIFYPTGGYVPGYVDVLLNGSQLNNSDFTANDAVSIVLVEPAVLGDELRLISYTLALASASGGLQYVVKTANYTAVDKQGILADTSTGAFAVTLPASPAVGAQVVVADRSGTWGTNNLTVARNGSTIETLAEDLVCDISGASIDFIYDGITWQVFAQTGLSPAVKNLDGGSASAVFLETQSVNGGTANG